MVALPRQGGVRKRVLRKGHGDKWNGAAHNLDEVTVHYEGRLEDGTVFDSSRERGEPLVFRLGMETVIKGWEIGIEKMRQGEFAELTVAPEYAYGEDGAPPDIPPNATLRFEIELLKTTPVTDVEDDRSLIKRFLKKGTGWKTPNAQSRVSVAFVAWVGDDRDAPFLTSGAPRPIPPLPTEAEMVKQEEETGPRDEAPNEGFVPYEPREFEMSACLCEGFRRALETMKVNERGRISMEARHAFGDEGPSEELRRQWGFTREVPGGAEIHIHCEIEDLRYTEALDNSWGYTCEMRSIKLDDGKSYKTPELGATVAIRYEGRLMDGTDKETGDACGGTVFERVERLSYVHDELQVPAGLDLAVSKMRAGEVARVRITDPASGLGAEDKQMPLAMVPGGSVLEYEVEVLEFENPKATFMMETSEEKMEYARQKKDEGNEWYKRGAAGEQVGFKRAVKKYEAVGSLMKGEEERLDDELKDEARKLRISCLNNAAQCYVKGDEPYKAVASATECLELDPCNMKAICRRAAAHMRNHDYKDAAADLKKARSIEPEDKDVLRLYAQLRQVVERSKARSKKLSEKMVTSAAKIESKNKRTWGEWALSWFVKP